MVIACWIFNTSSSSSKVVVECNQGLVLKNASIIASLPWTTSAPFSFNPDLISKNKIFSWFRWCWNHTCCLRIIKCAKQCYKCLIVPIIVSICIIYIICLVNLCLKLDHLFVRIVVLTTMLVFDSISPAVVCVPPSWVSNCVLASPKDVCGIYLY